MGESWDVVVVGGGLAGLAAGTYAARQGKEVLILEARQRGGGRATTVRTGGLPLQPGTPRPVPGWVRHGGAG